MPTDPRLENYLNVLERVLKPFSVSDRAEIVTEIKSHVLSALERDPQAQLDSVLAALGEPETVANRYLLERGLKPAKPPVSPMVKWVVIGFLGTFAMLLLFVTVLVVRFTPVLQIDEDKDHVSLFGGLIDIDGAEGRLRVGSSRIDGGLGHKRSFDGKVDLAGGGRARVRFGNGRVELSNATEGRLAWNCTATGRGQAPAPQESGGETVLDLSEVRGVKCEIRVPERARLAVDGTNGKIEIDEPRYDVDASLGNGKVLLRPEEGRAYRYALTVTNGKSDSFISSDAKDAHRITVHVGNGRISHGNE